MATYVVGDVQGCYEPLRRLLDSAEFSPTTDKIWFAGDLINRGPDNVRVLRFIMSLGQSAIAILGNHDLHLLAAAEGTRKPTRKDTIQDVLDAPDRYELLEWLRLRPLIHREGSFIMSHAGIPHIWSAKKAFKYSQEVEDVLKSEQHNEFYRNMYGNKPIKWDNDLQGWDRLRTITNYLTRMRFISQKGRLDFDCKKPGDDAPEGMKPWFDYPRKQKDKDITFLFGHWAALEGVTGTKGFVALDTGCVWGAQLTMIRLEDQQLFQVSNNPFL